MIKAEELMIGNWVMSIHPAVPRPIKVTEVDGNNIGYNNGILHISFIEPIPITPEILERNGWEHRLTGYVFHIGIDTPQGSYTYHYKEKYWGIFDCIALERAKHWDGHTDKDVERLLSL